MATLTETKQDDVTVLHLAGGLTFDGVVPLSRPFEAATRGGSVVIDLSGVPVVSTPGLSLLLSGLKRVQHHGGRLVLTGSTPGVRDLLRRCRLDRVFTLADDPSAAIGLFRGEGDAAKARRA